MPNYYAIVTKFSVATQDMLCVAIDSANSVVPFTVLRAGAPPFNSSVTTNALGFARVTLPAGTNDALVKVTPVLLGAVTIHQKDSSGTGLLYLDYPDESKSLGTGVAIARVDGTQFLLIGNKDAVQVTATITTHFGTPTTVLVSPSSVKRISLPTADSEVRVTTNRAVIFQTGLGTGAQSSVVVP